MPARKAKDLNVAMLVEVVASNYGDPYFHVIARVGKRVWDSERAEWRFDSGFGYDEPYYSRLRVSAQGNTNTDEPVYGWGVEFHEPYTVKLGDAEGMVKTLRAIERGLNKSNGELGWPESIGAYIARVARIIGADAFGFFPPRDEPMWSSGERIRWENASFLSSHIEGLVRNLREEWAKAHA